MPSKLSQPWPEPHTLLFTEDQLTPACSKGKNYSVNFPLRHGIDDASYKGYVHITLYIELVY